jgi:phosphatidylglycerophosphatase A
MRRFIAAGFGVGFLPRMVRGSDAGAGTVGSLLAAILAAALWVFPLWVHLVATLVIIGLSLWAPAPFLADDHDPGWVVIDEMAGTMVALTGLYGWPWATAFVVFRLADIFKQVPGVGQAERLQGALGVTADDLVAGGYGLAAGWALTALAGGL